MEQIREWATMLCTASVASGIMVFLIPEGKLKKTACIVTSLFILLVFMSIFSDFSLGEFDADVNFSVETEKYSLEFDDYLIKNSKETAEELIKNELFTICDGQFSIETCWHVSDNAVCMDSVIIGISKSDSSKISIIKSKIGALTGTVPEVNIK